jgi:hypothetical protein
MMRAHSLFSALLCALLAALAGTVRAAPDLPAPPNARVEQVTGAATVNGMQMAVRRFRVERSVDHVLRFYRQLWRAPRQEMPGYMENTFGPWEMITRLDGEWFLSVQVQSTGVNDAWGYLTVSHLDVAQARAKPGRGFPMMDGTSVVNDLRSDDMGKRGRTLLLANGFSAAANAEYYIGHYLDRGWRVAMDAPSDTEYTRVLHFQRTGAEVIITVHGLDKGSVVVANSSEY